MRHLLTGLILLSGLGGVAWLVHLGQLELRRDPVMLPVTFAHADHRTESCVICHHNFVDHTGAGLCFDCHKRDPAVNALIEFQFHDLCRNCHVERQARDEEAGPTRQCDACHTGDDEP
jgi:hypothetical protein